MARVKVRRRRPGEQTPSKSVRPLAPPTPARPRAAVPLPKLDSKRGRRVEAPRPCDVCRSFVRELWYYKESDQGEVFLCPSCKAKALDASFGQLDAMDVAQLGAFEANRRKH